MSPKRVLVIDDEAMIQVVVQGCFEDVAGWEVLTASSGQEGLEKASTYSPDAIVLDIMMSEMDGLDFLKLLKASPMICAIPIVLLTGKIDFIDLDKAAVLGVVGAIAKPFDPFLLVKQVAQFLGWKLEA